MLQSSDEAAEYLNLPRTGNSLELLISYINTFIDDNFALKRFIQAMKNLDIFKDKFNSTKGMDKKFRLILKINDALNQIQSQGVQEAQKSQEAMQVSYNIACDDVNDIKNLKNDHLHKKFKFS